ncbi:MAG: hypothetical protein CFE50_04930 [Pseudomonas sp. PGPPP4]|uniref:FRG domain-containing protein n=1 Tax=Pseudomonas sp. PGPPP4 TaxID=2015556 RepID=UPI000BDB56B0|nr:FRG domain-containing protein [Pseudomonas sp. PGPPP4]OYT85377.1 MAG: hypothetical protein CFE50_04930 [Pseudomonas sp. PGPPP4]
MEKFEATNVEEAVSLAERLKKEGRYNWFRGQLRDWEPCSSLERKLGSSIDAKQHLDAKLSRFLKWVEGQPPLAYLAQEQHVDSLFAVLQHYGFPTAYIDFTTEPSIAGFFASDTQTPPEEFGKSVIYCLNTEDLEAFYKSIPFPSEGEPFKAEPLTIKVNNLWRLQSQHGHFLFANHPWYRLYDMDRIVFPWTGMPAFPPREQIYPNHKSPLEQLLDMYFFNERLFEGEAAIRNMTKGGKNLFHYFQIEKAETHESNSFKLPPKTSKLWDNQILKEWHTNPIEDFHSTVGRQITLPLRSGPAAPSAADQIIHSIKSALNSQPALRHQAIDWNFTEIPKNVDHSLFKSSICDAWNGMRNLPYTNEDIAFSFSALIVLCGIPDCRSLNGHMVDQAFRSWVSDAVHIEFGYPGASYSRAYCSGSKLFKALDPEWISNLKSPELAKSITEAFHQTHDPRLMFDFTQLKSIFAREIIPSQLAMKRPLVLYNPANLDVFGLP